MTIVFQEKKKMKTSITMILTNILIIFSLNFIESLLKLIKDLLKWTLYNSKNIQSNNGTIEKQYIISELKI
jgi:hypothetical protein